MLKRYLEGHAAKRVFFDRTNIIAAYNESLNSPVSMATDAESGLSWTGVAPPPTLRSRRASRERSRRASRETSSRRGSWLPGLGSHGIAPVSDSDLYEMRDALYKRLDEGLHASRAIVVIQTEGAYSNPLTLFELYWAERMRKPIVCVRLGTEAYDFASVAAMLADLEAHLRERTPAAHVHFTSLHFTSAPHLGQH